MIETLLIGFAVVVWFVLFLFLPRTVFITTLIILGIAEILPFV